MIKISLRDLILGRGSAHEAAQALRLSFDALPADSQKVEKSLGGLVEKAVLSCNGRYVYHVGPLSGISGSDEKAAAMVKGEVLREVSSSGLEIGDASEISRVIGISGRFLGGSMTGRETIAYMVAHDIAGYGPLSMLMEDKEGIEEIEVNSPSSVISVVSAEFGRCSTNLRFRGEDEFRVAVNKMAYSAEKSVGFENPVVDLQLGNARVHAQIKPYAASGAAASIRMGGFKKRGLVAIIKSGMITCEAAAYAWMLIDSGMCMVICGPPASGKTTMLSALMELDMPYRKTIVVEEEINEIRFASHVNNLVSLYGSRYGRVGAGDQVVNALRLRPEMIVVGEMRCSEARELFAGGNIGVPFLATMHSNAEPIAVVNRLLSSPMSVETGNISALDSSIHTIQDLRGTRRICAVFEYRWLSRAETDGGEELSCGDSVEFSGLWEEGNVSRKMLGSSKVIEKYSRFKGVSKKASLREFENRSAFLEGLISENIGQNEAEKKLFDYKIRSEFG